MTLARQLFGRLGIEPPHWGSDQSKVDVIAGRLARVAGRVRTNVVWQAALAAAGRKLDWIGHDNFLVLSTIRSGSTVLVDYLNCHPRVRCRGEILNDDHAYYGQPRRMRDRRLALHVEAMFVKRSGFHAGAKILLHQLDDRRLNAGDVLQMLPISAVVALYRENTLDQYASFKMAERSGIWHAGQRPRNEPIQIDPDDFVAFAGRIRRMWRENLARLGDSRVCFLRYEDLLDECASAMRRVFDCLGVEACSIRSPLVKLRPKSVEECVKNYRDFLRPGVRDFILLDRPSKPLRMAA